jgi:hypothetical protein
MENYFATLREGRYSKTLTLFRALCHALGKKVYFKCSFWKLKGNANTVLFSCTFSAICFPPAQTLQDLLNLNSPGFGNTAIMRWAHRFKSRMATSNYRRRPFYAVKVFQLVSCLVDFAIMVYFVAKLRGSHMPIPWTFIVVSSSNPTPTILYLPVC